MMEGVQTWLSSQAAEFLTQAYKKLFPDNTSTSIPAVTMLRSSLSMHAFFIYNNFLSLLILLAVHRRLQLAVVRSLSFTEFHAINCKNRDNVTGMEGKEILFSNVLICIRVLYLFISAM
jgi:hypothetical protein